MVFRLGCGYFSSQVNIQKRVWCSSTHTISNIGLNNLKITYFPEKHSINFKITDLQTKKQKILTFEEFKKIKVKSFEEFANSDTKELLYNNDIKKIQEAYERFCHKLFLSYQRDGQGNPLYVI